VRIAADRRIEWRDKRMPAAQVQPSPASLHEGFVKNYRGGFARGCALYRYRGKSLAPIKYSSTALAA
jgi:hypothetical protein